MVQRIMEKKLDDILLRSSNYYKNLILKKGPVFDFKKPVVIFGTAKLLPHFIRYFKIKKTKVLFLIDSDKSKIGLNIYGMDVISKEILLKKLGKDIQIVIASVHYEVIIKKLKKIGFSNLFNPMYFFTFDHNKFNLLTWINNVDLLFKNKKKVKSAFLSFSDEKSKKVFVDIIKFRLTFNQSLFENINNNKSEYFDKKIIRLLPNEVFLDGGAYDGDTIRIFINKSKNKFSKIFAYEPDEKSFTILKRYLKDLSDKRIFGYKIGLGQKNEKLRFTNEGNLQSKVSNKGKFEIKIIPIDSIKEGVFTYIKLDIEGFEKQALLGAKKTIYKYKPKLAICSYHHFEDLWEVPNLIHKINRNYKLFLRHYTNFLFDTICYAV